MRFVKRNLVRVSILITMASLLVLGVKPFVFHTNAAELPNRKIELSTSLIGDTGRYRFSFEMESVGASVGSIRFQFCANSPLIDDSCTAPVGLDVSSSTLIDQQTNTGFAIGAGTDANTIVLTRAAVPANAGTSVYEFDNVRNPNNYGTYYVRLQTYAATFPTAMDVDHGGLAYSLNRIVSVSTTVPPFLLMCTGITITGFDCTTATGNYINFGELSSTSPRTGTTQMVLATNATDGYVVTVNGTTMLSGVNSIPAITFNDVSRPGTSQFGINLRKNTDPNVGANVSGAGSAAVAASYGISNRYHFISGEQIASTTNADNYRKYTVSYLVNIAKDQKPGIYVSTLTYVAVATF